MFRRLVLTKPLQRWTKLQTSQLCSDHSALSEPFSPPNGACGIMHCWSAAHPKQTGATVPEQRPHSVKLVRAYQTLAAGAPVELGNHTCLCVRRSTLHTSSSLLAGHNKWSKVKYIKGPKDQQKSLLATKIVSQMRVVIKEGGPNPDMNPELARLVALAKSNGIPKATIENAIKSAVNSKDKEGTQHICEGQGPKGSAVIVEYVTDNMKRSRDELVHIFKAHGCTAGGQGSVLYAFKRKGVIELGNPEDQDPMTYDLAMEIAIEAGAEDVITEEEEEEAGQMVFKLICSQSDFRSVRAALGKTNHRLGMASLEYIPESNVALTAPELEKMGALIAKLEEHPSVLRVSHNITEET